MLLHTQQQQQQQAEIPLVVWPPVSVTLADASRIVPEGVSKDRRPAAEETA